MYFSLQVTITKNDTKSFKCVKISHKCQDPVFCCSRVSCFIVKMLPSCVPSCFSVPPSVFFPHLSFSRLTPPVPDPLVVSVCSLCSESCLWHFLPCFPVMPPSVSHQHHLLCLPVICFCFYAPWVLIWSVVCICFAHTWGPFLLLLCLLPLRLVLVFLLKFVSFSFCQ